ncbi:uncharacterized protein LOC107637688 [Arachis ipaensis]|uniref:uncharacterized protein LOC107637688 n=1 Tax=Arachis ipaensis TaxID=130454 RepID=UPI000A2B2AB4|nr:uncharacterized protein LOC107637688 [Arachis ipaensis]
MVWWLWSILIQTSLIPIPASESESSSPLPLHSSSSAQPIAPSCLFPADRRPLPSTLWVPQRRSQVSSLVHSFSKFKPQTPQFKSPPTDLPPFGSSAPLPTPDPLSGSVTHCRCRAHYRGFTATSSSSPCRGRLVAGHHRWSSPFLRRVDVILISDSDLYF